MVSCQEIEGDEDGSDVDANENYNNVTDANNSEGLEKPSKSKTIDEKQNLKREKKKSEPTTKKYDRAIFVEAKGKHFEIHFRFTGEPHILLTQVLFVASNFCLICCINFGVDVFLYDIKVWVVIAYQMGHSTL